MTAEVPEQVFRHIITKQHDDWKYSIDATVGPADNRHTIKVRGDSLKEVLADLILAKGVLKPKEPE